MEHVLTYCFPEDDRKQIWRWTVTASAERPLSLLTVGKSMEESQHKAEVSALRGVLLGRQATPPSFPHSLKTPPEKQQGRKGALSDPGHKSPPTCKLTETPWTLYS